MARYSGSKAKLCRKLGVNIFGTSKIDKIMSKRPGKKRNFSKTSEYGTQLREKQLAKLIYGLSEKQFKKYYFNAVKSSNVTGEEFIRQMEIRVDNVLYRAGIAKTRAQARQIISHGHYMLNGKVITIPSIQVRPGDKLSLRKKSQNSSLFSGDFDIKKVQWISTDSKRNEISILSLPESNDLEQSIKTHLIIEFYSR